MTERLFNTFQIASLLRAAPGAVVEWMVKGWLNSSRTPGGVSQVTESDLVRFLEDQGFDFGEELTGAFTAEQRDEVYRRARARKAAANGAGAPVKTARSVAAPEPDQPDEADEPSEPVYDQPAEVDEPSEPVYDQPAEADESSEPVYDQPAEADEPSEPVYDQPVETDDQPEAEMPEIEADELPLPEAPEVPLVDAALSGLLAGQICDAILADAVKHGARAVHLTPHRDGLKLQLRINGSLRDKPQFNRRLPDGLRREIIACFLNRANLDIAAGDLVVPHSVEFTRSIEGSQLTLRLSALPTVNGPRLVICMPCPVADIELLALEDAARPRLEKLLQGDGLIVVASKRRIGRDLTLRALLAAADTDGRNVIAIEQNSQPELDDVAQIQIDPLVGLTCATAMAAMEDQDADTIILTELRDPATALAAFDAAHDGALVIAGINAISALAAISELLAMGLEPWPLASTLKAIVEQASVRTLCEHCRQSAGGCDLCAQTGWSGRMVLSGVVFVEGQLAELIRTGAADEQFERAIAQIGSGSLAHAAQVAVDTGVTTPAEVARILRRS